MGFLNYNKIFDINIFNLETACYKICDDLTYCHDITDILLKVTLNTASFKLRQFH
jgi:hypothetical protein